MVTVAPEQVSQRRRLDIHALRPESPGVGLDSENNPEVIQQRGDQGVEQDLEVAYPQELGDDERRGSARRGGAGRAAPAPAPRDAAASAAAPPGGGGERIAPTPAAASTPPPASRGYPLRCSIGQATE